VIEILADPAAAWPYAAIQLACATKVVIVPGYGLAAAQAQHEAVALAATLSQYGVEVSYAIHPVAGRMPGHMNLLLAEARPGSSPTPRATWRRCSARCTRTPG
jgi:NAD/NADP transhydrogenase beta subunit